MRIVVYSGVVTGPVDDPCWLLVAPAEVGLLQIRTNLLTAEVDLYRAMGGGWTAPGR